MRGARPVLALATLVAATLGAGCRSYTLTQADCDEFRQKLEGWAKAKGKESPEAVEKFNKTCPGTVISRGTRDCIEKAADEAAFFKCLD